MEIESDGNLSRMISSIDWYQAFEVQIRFGELVISMLKKNKDVALKEMFKCKKIL